MCVFGPQAKQRNGAGRPGGRAGLRCFFGFWRGGNTSASCSYTPTKPGVSKRSIVPFGTQTLLARCSVLYLMARAAPAGRKKGRGFANNNPQNLCPVPLSASWTLPTNIDNFFLCQHYLILHKADRFNEFTMSLISSRLVCVPNILKLVCPDSKMTQNTDLPVLEAAISIATETPSSVS